MGGKLIGYKLEFNKANFMLNSLYYGRWSTIHGRLCTKGIFPD